MTNVIPIQRARDKHDAEARAAEQFADFTPTTTPTDIHTASLPMRVVDDEGTLRLYPAVVHDCGVEDKQVRDKAGRAFGRMFSSEPIAVSAELAEHILTLTYGSDVSARMLRDADKGDYVFGSQVTHTGNGHKWKGGVNVASDLSRESGYVIQFSGLRQTARKA